MTKGFFISFEGCEGCGKSTLCTYINSELGKRGYISTLTREPGGTIIGEKIRSLLLHDHTVGALSDHTELLLFLASRA